jgi:ankyrin repeat protein
MVCGGNNHLSQDSSYQPIAITAPGEDGHISAYEAAASSMDVDEGSKIGTLREHSSSDMRPGGVVSSEYYRKPQASAPGDHQGDHSTRTVPAQDGSILDDTENSDEGEDVDDSHGAAIGDDAIPLRTSSAPIFPPWSDGEIERASKDRHGYIDGLQRVVIHRNNLMPNQIALNPMGHRGSSDSGIGLEYSSYSRPASSMRDSLNQEPNGEKWAFSKHLLHSISCSVNHQGRDFNFHCCGSSCLQELALSALNMPPQQVYEHLCQYKLWEGVRLYDYAGNTFLHKLAITGVPWSYFEAGLNAHINPCHRNAYGQTFAHVLNFSAFQTNLMECLTSLRSLGIDFGLRDASGRTVLHCLYGQPMTPTTARQILQLIDSPGRLLSLRDVSGRTPCEIFKHTFSQQVTANPRRSTTELQLQMVGIFEDIVDGGVLRLKDEGVDWSIITDNPEDLRTALQNQYSEVINNAENGIVVEAVDGSNAFHAQAALMTFHDAPTDLRSLKKFISIGIDANDYDNYGRTPLEAVITQPRDYETELTTSEKVSLLIDRGKASVHSRNRLGHTPLYSAAIRGLDRTVEALLRRSSHTNIRDNDGQSLLKAVIEASHRAFVEYCESGYCRYHEAQCSRIEECKMLLERYGAVPDPTPAQSMGYAARRPIPQ